MAYEWTVRSTWDRAGQQSPPGAGAFETGISDIQWEGASWIRRATTDADDYTLARTEVHPNTSPVVRARAYTAADHTHELYLNGTRADGIEDGRAVFQVGSGRSTFHPVADTAAQPR
ncbi:hypothetical protein [Micromonospora fulviviridis]|uniref:hypothetical protein n=1 Tax=Micromonospora fulviviridis TaxID=47860 RepID=UPI0037971B30